MSSQQVTVSRSRKTAKKTTKKEYYFSSDIWRLIKEYVGTPEQYIIRSFRLHYYSDPSFYLGPLVPRCTTYGIPITLSQYEIDGFKIQHTNGWWIDVKPTISPPVLKIITTMMKSRMPHFNIYCRRIVKVLVKTFAHPKYVNTQCISVGLSEAHLQFRQRIECSGDYIVVYSNRSEDPVV